ALYTYGMLGVELTGSSGEALQLASGKTATLTMSIAASQSASAPATIPLWYFDETTSLWKEEGAANKVGNNYVGMVKHFSWWNCDIGANSPIIKGKVVDCNGVPVPNCVVTFDEWATTVTDQNGEFQGRVPAATSITVQVLASNNTGIILNSQLENVPSLTNNQTFMVPDLVIPCITRVKGDLKSCSGETIAGFVSISNTSHFSFQYTLNGSFNLPAPSNNQMTLYAANSVFYQSQNITTLTAPNDLNSGNILLCDSLNANLMNNNFILNGGPFSNQLFNFNLTNSTAFVNDSTHGISIAMNGTAAPDYNIMGFSMGITDSVTGVTTCGFNFLININNTSSTYQILTPNYIYCNVTEMGTIGNKIKGNYFGAVYMNLNPGWIWGNISGNFDVIRTQ
ncbi:MAG: carboxypeptidase-like regulatory domain-containing protein, partial [Bacteroidota bacterium]